jgi:putative transposase
LAEIDPGSQPLDGDRGIGSGVRDGAQEYGGLKTEQVKRLKELETENARLRKAISDLTLHKLILQEAARGNF